MKFRDFIVTPAICAELKATDRDGVIRELVTSLADNGAVPAAAVDELVAALIKREENGTTGFGKGVAVPHVQHSKVKKIVGTVGRTVKGIDFDALDQQPVHIVFILLSPENQSQQRMAAMQTVFLNVNLPMFRKYLGDCTTREAIVDLLDEYDQGK